MNASGDPWDAIGYASGTGDCGELVGEFNAYGTLNGCFFFASEGVLCAETPEDGGQQLNIIAFNFDAQNVACVTITGTRAENIGTHVYYDIL